MGGILQVDTIQNNNATTLITQTNSTTLTFGVSGQNIVIPSGVTFNTASATINLPSTINATTINVTTVVLAAGAVGTPSLTTSGDTNTGIFFPSADTIAFTEGGVEGMRLNASGNVQFAKNISVGGATPTTSGSGITFPATQSASTDANTLDDYEEGTWTPTDISGASLSFTGAEGTYVKIGRQVIASFILTFPSTANGTAVYIGGLPFTPANGNDNFQGNVSTTNYGSSDIVLWCTFAPSSGIRLRNYSDSALSNANLSTKYIAGQTIYRI